MGGAPSDLCYVVAIAQSALGLHHAASHGDVGHGLVYFAWFNSAYDNDDVINRLLTLLQVFGSLVLAAGISRMFDGDFLLGVTGYTIMRVGLILMWLRAAAGHPERRRTALRYAVGLALVQVLWIAFLTANGGFLLPVFVVFAIGDFGVPFFAERAGQTPWHPHHIAERYALFFIIVLGETVLSSTIAIQEAIDGENPSKNLIYVVIGGVLIIFSVWWLYFAREYGKILSGNNVAFVWGSGHYVIFGAGAALGAGLAVRVDYYGHEAHISELTSAAFVTVPVAMFLAALWFFCVRMADPSIRTWGPFLAAIAAVGLATFGPKPELLAGLICVALLVVELRLTHDGAAVEQRGETV